MLLSSRNLVGGCAGLRVYQRGLLPPPKIKDLSPADLAIALAVEAQLATLASRPTQTIMDVDRVGEWLRHYLSPHWMATHPPEAGAIRTDESEFALCQSLSPLLTPVLEPAPLDQFSKAIETAYENILGSRPALRKGAITTAPCLGNSVVSFPPVEAARSNLVAIHSLLKEMPLSGLAAIGTLGLILNAHLGLNGNGRLARILFNLILRRRLDLPFIPLKRIADDAHGGFELAIRETELKGSWNALLQYFRRMFDIILDGQ